MKLNVLFTLLLSLILNINAFGQTSNIEYGILEEYQGRANRISVGGIDVSAEGSNPTSTDNNGLFELEFEKGITVVNDFDFDKEVVRITKSYQRINGQDIVTDPKTPKSNRIIQMPDFLADEIKEYLESLYGYDPKERIFPITKSFLHHEMNRGCKETGVKRIRIHDLRHSHVSLLIDLGFSAVAIADRVGHESIDITYRYAHLFPTTQKEIASKLNLERS